MGLLVYVGIEPHVLVGGDEREQVVAHGVCAIPLHEVHGIHAVALGLTHAAAVLGEDRGIDVHVMERHLPRKVERAHHHASHPERNDVASGHEDLRGMVAAHLLEVIGPALCGERCIYNCNICLFFFRALFPIHQVPWDISN